MDKYREMARKLDLDADALNARADGYRMAGSRDLALSAILASKLVRQAADQLRAMRDAEELAQRIGELL